MFSDVVGILNWFLFYINACDWSGKSCFIHNKYKKSDANRKNMQYISTRCTEILKRILGFLLKLNLWFFYCCRMGLTQDSKVWVGAWWIGFLLSAFMCLILAIPVLAFPPALPGEAISSQTFVYSVVRTSKCVCGLTDSNCSFRTMPEQSSYIFPIFFWDLFPLKRFPYLPTNSYWNAGVMSLSSLYLRTTLVTPQKKH